MYDFDLGSNQIRYQNNYQKIILISLIYINKHTTKKLLINNIFFIPKKFILKVGQ